ncbi:MAG: DUF2264 domain-containing protein, partial [Chitinophagaceae bacterium]|nr:DUF2264 domain-containing protein [Chitinophagaceae bacterium]
MQRRKFIRWSSLLSVAGLMPVKNMLAISNKEDKNILKNKNDRKYWVSLLDKIATPVLSNMSNGELKKNMKVAYSPTWDGRNNQVAYMEAFGRLIAGLA